MFIGMKKLLIALLSINALLIALLTAQATQAAWTKSEKATVTALEQRIQQLEQLVQSQSSQSAQNTSKGYDAIKLAEYSACLNSYASSNTYQEWKNKTVITFCSIYKP